MLKLNYGIQLCIIGFQDIEIVKDVVSKLKSQNKWRDIDYVTGNLGSQLQIIEDVYYIDTKEYNYLLVFDDNSQSIKDEIQYARSKNIPIYIYNNKSGFNDRIVVENIKTYSPQSNDYTVYVGRGDYVSNYNARLGNPFTVEQYGRHIAIQKYKEWIEPSKYKSLINQLKTVPKTKRIVLLCWCKPLPCHADIIKEYLLKEGI